MKNTLTTHRLDYLDAVRAFALLLGIVFHASLSFIPIFIGWAVMDISTSSIVSVFLLISHSFRMEVFFLIAGFFSHMTFHGKGARDFLKSRFMRIAIPFVIAWFILSPLIVSCWVMGGESMRGEVNILNSLKIGFATLENLPTGIFTGSHLWFLYYLLLITTTLLLLRTLLKLHQASYRSIVRMADAITHWISHSRFAIPALSVPTAGCIWFMSHWGMDTPDKSLFPHLTVSLVYGGFFLLGWLLHRQKELITQFSRLSWGKFVLCIIATLATVKLSPFEMQINHTQYTLIKATYLISYALMMWTLVSLTIGLFKRYLDRPSKTVRYIADASYWLYLVHLPIVIWLQIAFAELPLHWSIKLVAISTLTIGLSLLVYDFFIRPTIIGKTLNGRKKGRLLFPSKPQPKSAKTNYSTIA